MKKNLGKILFILFVPLLLSAQNTLATYTLSANKTEAYEREAIEVTFSAKQQDHDEEMFFFLEPHQSRKYEITLLNKATKKLGYHDTAVTFTYMLFAKEVGEVEIGFDFTVKTASDEAVAQIYVGSRDNVKLLETTDTEIATQPLKIKVKPLRKGTQLVGDFKLSKKLLNSNVDQFSTVNVTYTLNGVGYIDPALKPLSSITNVTLFEEIVDKAFKASKNGYVVDRDYVYAISADDDFEIPAVHFQAYSPRTDSYYDLSTQGSRITVTKIDPNTLLDDKESPAISSYDFTWIKNSVIALLIFMAGFVSAKLSDGLRFSWLQRSERFLDIKESGDAKALLNVLVVNYRNKNVERYIDILEMMIYHNSKQSFKRVKRELLKQLHNEA